MDVTFLPSEDDIENWRDFTPSNPLRILFGACLVGDLCLTDGTGLGELNFVQRLISHPNVKHFKFCPENFAIGTPRGMPDIHGGNGFDVLDGRAKVLDEHNNDLTELVIKSANRMLEITEENLIDMAILPDISASCGSQVISDGCRLVKDRKYQKGPGVCAALLLLNGVTVISHRDLRTLENIHEKLDPNYEKDINAIDHHESEWYQEYFD